MGNPIFTNTKDRFNEFKEYITNTTTMKRIPLGFSKLDEFFKGGISSELVILGAMPSLRQNNIYATSC